MSKSKSLALKNAEIKHEGNEIILPLIDGTPMTLDEGITWLQRKKEEMETKMAVFNEIPCSPLDGLVAFHRAIADKYGFAQNVSIPATFFENEKPPVMIGVPISETERLNVPYGRIVIPGISGYLSTGIKMEPKPAFIIGGEILKKSANAVKELVALTERFLREQSIYKAHAVKVDFEWEREGDDYDPTCHAPRFLELKGVNDDDLIFGEKVTAALNIGLFTPIEQSEACRRYNVPLKRGTLLYGIYGTGKTMTAFVTAIKAVRNGWTFVYLKDVRDLRKGLEFAAQYAPAVLFAEDIDRAISGERSVDIDEVLNIIDGVDTKGAEIITVLTTNHIENINQAMLRPGRLDTLVEVLPPDANAAERLVKLYARGLLAEDVDLKKVGKALAGQIPAFIREVTERAKIAAISRTNGGDIEGKVLEVDLINASKAMESHIEMLKPRDQEVPGNPELMIKIPANHPATAKALSSFKPNGSGANVARG